MRLSDARDLKATLMRQAIRAIDQGRLPLGAKFSRGVTAVGLAFGIGRTRRDHDYQVAIRVHKGRERSLASLLESLSAAERSQLDVVTKVELNPEYRLRAGTSIGHGRITAGTLGGFVTDSTGALYILSNNHVLANRDAADRGDDIWQPGPSDAQLAQRQVVARLSRWLKLDTASSDNCDAAIAAVDTAFIDNIVPLLYTNIGAINPSPIDDPGSVQKVIKLGRTTGKTTGMLAAFEIDGLQQDCGTRAKPRVIGFRRQIEIRHWHRSRAFTQPGDSGAFVLDADTLRPLALHHSGAVGGDGIKRSYGHPMADVLQRLRVRIVT